MTQIIHALDDIARNYDAIFCDLWGCLHNGVAAYPAAVSALRDFRAGGGKVVLLTNAPRPQRYVAEQLDRMNVPQDAYDAIVTSGDAAQDAMFAGAVGRRVWAIAQPKDEGFFTDVPPEWQDADPIIRVPMTEAEGIVCTGLFDDETETPDDYRTRLILCRERGLPMLCANPDVVVDLGAKRLYCAGALAELYEDLGGKALYFGKPHPPIYDLARRRLGLAEDARVLAIGDGIATDIQGAHGEGMDALFVTGGLAHDQFGRDVENPDPERLREWLALRSENPRYSIGRLR
ncbi:MULTISPECIES: TIGR01459 family HAD-type hydrolase [unclassified Paracoccus (in: a-proteobacteria)]|uniref:TIGR01459 family HAD-type hydrolase n=1 Tax=unclassified Paracoccus (in: a-proteobacteria) TaxID=2688777 RepID=UPI0012B24943|nr:MULTISPECIES: TIGR01459 family HAD-type hydrolase [unclassified Paracoccus (in: a-proteobacteria)]UXU74221.1 TIGR01459 family HAD-type hydrolase [Paracoccus sp. SMMA_5]UXU80111.1 TIGR01459 family HAD-type hydrolase [Paracoccus sp. SMMA_5_TC]